MSKTNRTASLLAADNGLRLHSERDALDALASGLPACIFTLGDLHPQFFDLKNGIAGAVFQKFVNYGFRAAFVVPADHALGARTTELIRDHARHPCIRFFPGMNQAREWLEPDSLQEPA